MKKRTDDTVNTAVIKSISVTLCFVAAFALIVAALYMYNTKGEFLSAFKLSYGFYLPAATALVVTSLVYTPVSFGISYYFINAAKGEGSFTDVFCLFKKPMLLLKAVSLTVYRRILTELQRLAVLLLALLIECAVFVICVTLYGENIFDYENNFFNSVADFITDNDFFIIFTVIGWLFTICILFYIKIKYILCKYVLICNPLIGVLEAVRIGRFAVRGREMQIARFYLGYLSVYVFTFLTLGRFRAKNKSSFSAYACRLTKDGIAEYFESSC